MTILEVCNVFEQKPYPCQEWMYATTKKDSIFNKVYHVVGNEKKKMEHFFLCFQMLFKGRAMTTYKSMRKLLHFMMSRVFQTQVVGKSHLTHMIWLFIDPNIWLKVLSAFLFHMMKWQLLINNLGFHLCLCCWRLVTNSINIILVVNGW